MIKLQKYLIVAGVFCGLYGLGVLCIIGANHWFNFFGFILCVCFECFALFLPRFRRLPVIIKKSMVIVTVLCMAIFLLFEIFIILEAQSEPEQNATYVVILGAKVNGREPSLTLSRRIASAAEYMLENPDSIAVATGGRGADESIAEGEAIARGLVALGVDTQRVLKETSSTSTRENLIFALEIIEDYGGTVADSVVIVSSAFHLYRAKRLAQTIGYEDISGQGSSSMLYLVPHYYLREFVAVFKEKIEGNL